MLPNITLQLGEFTAFDNDASGVGLLPDGADSLDAN